MLREIPSVIRSLLPLSLYWPAHILTWSWDRLDIAVLALSGALPAILIALDLRALRYNRATYREEMDSYSERMRRQEVREMSRRDPIYAKLRKPRD